MCLQIINDKVSKSWVQRLYCPDLTRESAAFIELLTRYNTTLATKGEEDRQCNFCSKIEVDVPCRPGSSSDLIRIDLPTNGTYCLPFIFLPYVSFSYVVPISSVYLRLICYFISLHRVR